MEIISWAPGADDCHTNVFINFNGNAEMFSVFHNEYCPMNSAHSCMSYVIDSAARYEDRTTAAEILQECFDEPYTEENLRFAVEEEARCKDCYVKLHTLFDGATLALLEEICDGI